MRFCLVSTQENFGGGEVLLASIADELMNAGHSVGWIVRGQSQVAELLEYHRGSRLYACRKRGRNLRDLLAVRAVFRDWAPDVIVMNDSHAVLLAGLAAKTLRSPRPRRLAYKHTVFPLRSRLKYRLLTDKVICVSNAAREMLLRGGMHADESVVVYGGTAPIRPSTSSRQEIRRELGIVDENTRLLVCVGSLLSCKGHSDLLSAIAQLDPALPLMQVIAGEGVERANLERQIRSQGLEDRVRLLGFRHDAEQLMQAADLIVHPSHAEGLSLVLIQAQMLGKPIVATAVGGAAEVLGLGKPEYCTPWVAKARDPENLAQQIEQALKALKDRSIRPEIESRLAINAERTSYDFSLTRNASRLADIAAQLL
ncbi:MAG: glycosyltransferase [bacterium]|nr:glycosyltransferase [bacterium]